MSGGQGNPEPAKRRKNRRSPPRIGKDAVPYRPLAHRGLKLLRKPTTNAPSPFNAREQRAVIDMATKLIAGAKPTVPGEVQVADDYERRLRTAARLIEIMSAAGFHCEFRPGGTLH